MKDKPEKFALIDKPFFIFSGLIIIIMMTLMVIFEKQSGDVLQIMYNVISKQFGFVFIISTVLFLFFILWLAFGKYSEVKFGGSNAKPEFKTFSWIAMFFCSGMGTALLAWGIKEWAYYYQTPPFGIKPLSIEAAEYSSAYSMFHWGILGWTIYCVLAFPIGYMYWNKNHNTYKFSDSCTRIIGKKNANGLLGKIIDFSLILGLIGANGTSLGSGTPMLSESISVLFSIEHTQTLDVIVVIIWTAIFTTSVTLGLKKGIKKLSDINLVLALGLCIFVFAFGPTSFIVDNFVNSTGIIFKEFFRMSLYTDPIGKTAFPQDWTVFYWAWYYAYAPFMGAFIARVSRGRTFRETGLVVLLSGSLGCAVFHAILGGNALNLQLNGLYDFVGVMNDPLKGDSVAIIGSLKALPFSVVVLVIFVSIGFVYSATTIDSAAYTMATTSCKAINKGEEPPRYARIFWAITMGVIAVVVLKIGGLVPIKTTSLVVALPIVVFTYISLAAFLKDIKDLSNKTS